MGFLYFIVFLVKMFNNNGNNQMPPPGPMGYAPYPQQGAFMNYQQQPYGGQNDGGYRGRGGGGGGRGRGGQFFVPGYQQQGPQMYGGRGGQPGAFRARKKKPFHGGSLETQRQWERAHICCFFLQGQCKFNDGCRFSHEDDGKPCQFGDQCKVGHASRVEEKAPEGAAEQPQ
eukprot:GILI01000859.1.p1 GENE.GILI01000859.1~~GILI01000859.1.p1  ORF type:complete len:172 (-),score=29.28 GILI01000859.1:77-592(-)